MKSIWILLGVVLILSGCGQKGPLYLPQTTAAPVAVHATTVTHS